MSLERIAVATAVISTAVGAASLLLAWYRGSTHRRPRLARTLGGITLASTLVLIVALAFASGGSEDADPPPHRSLSAGEYRLRVIGVCKKHERDAIRIEDAEGGEHPLAGAAVLLETRAVEKLKALRPPKALDADHRRVLVLWERRVSLLGYYYDRSRSELADPAFRRRFTRDLKLVEALSRQLQRLFRALGVTPECNLF
jgi:hypothetical protein